MPQSRTIKSCTRLSTIGGVGVMETGIPTFPDISIIPILNTTTKVLSEFYLPALPGELILYKEGLEDLVFSINKSGELIVIYPENLDISINNSGELLISKN